MESPVLSDLEIKWEARRIAAAFGVETLTQTPYNATITDFFSQWQGLALWWTLDSRRANSTWRLFDIKGDGKSCQVGLLDPLGEFDEEDDWELWSYGEFNDIMARWLYRLGFEDKDIWSDLGVTLTAHEKLELRLTLPREFWPKRWLDEEAL